MTKVSSVTLMVCSLQFNSAVRFRTIVGFSRKTGIYKHVICFELQIAKLSATASHGDMWYLKLMRGSLVHWEGWELPAGPALPCKWRFLPFLGKIL